MWKEKKGKFEKRIQIPAMYRTDYYPNLDHGQLQVFLPEWPEDNPDD